MKYINFIIFLAIIAYVGSPYYNLYKLNEAVNYNNKAAFAELIDIEAVRKVEKDNIAWKTKQIVPQQGQGNIISEMARQSAQMLGNTAVDTMIDANSMLALLRKNSPLWDKLSYAFFESPTRFIIRIGELGRQPIFVQMTLQDWSWRITAIYD
jgi:hypothetical protein